MGILEVLLPRRPPNMGAARLRCAPELLLTEFQPTDMGVSLSASGPRRGGGGPGGPGGRVGKVGRESRERPSPAFLLAGAARTLPIRQRDFRKVPATAEGAQAAVLKELGDEGPPRHGRAPSLVSQEDATHKESRGGLVSSKRVSACDSWGLKGLRDGLRLATAVSAREREEQTGQLRVLKELGDEGPPRHGRAPSLVSQEDATHKESRGGLVSSKRVSACDSWGLKGLRDGLRLATALGSWQEARGYSIQIVPWSPTGGLCNLCPDRANKEHVLQAGGVPLIINCLSSPNEETVLSAITTLMHLSPPGHSFPPELTAAPVVQCMLRFSLSASARLRNLAQIFLEDFCSPRQVAEARSRQAHSALGIPLPRSMAPRQR
ncbi:PREDICTED: armadillo repeat-containing protein 7 [Mandrillus leucophaeus]|uniref:armadillo repeat-containing protein 7 n=1 Tax=Mandrillus leucophaeus TaxID=9568 RepID=UPI0005F463A0|nr:PREDICTED: armadillo repeat-containing protein 7 [Mandrillus leucophaeus]